MVLKDLRWFPYEDKKWDIMNLVKDNTYEIVRTPKIVEYLPNDISRYIEELEIIKTENNYSYILLVFYIYFTVMFI